MQLLGEQQAQAGSRMSPTGGGLKMAQLLLLLVVAVMTEALAMLLQLLPAVPALELAAFMAAVWMAVAATAPK